MPKPIRWNNTGHRRDAVFHDFIFHVNNLIVIHFNENLFNRVIYTVINFGSERFEWKILKNNEDIFLIVKIWKGLNKVKRCTTIHETCIQIQLNSIIVHKNWSFPLRISSVNVTKSAGNHRKLVTFTEEILNGKLYFLCSMNETENIVHVHSVD